MESKAQHHDGVTSSLGLRRKTPSPRPLAAVAGQEAALSCNYRTYRFFRAMALAGHQNAQSLERILSKRKRQLVALEPAVHTHRLHAGGKLSASSPAVAELADWTSSALDSDSGDADTAAPEVDLSLRLCSSSTTAPEVDLSPTTAPEVDLSLRLWSGPRNTIGRRGDVTQPPTGSRRRKNQAEKM